MWDPVIATGKGFKGPGMHDLRGALLQKEIPSIDEYLAEYKDSWLKTCCSIMSDGWMDGKNRTIINLLISCPQGTMFFRLVDAFDKVKDATLLFEILDDIIHEVGEQNIVQVITGNAPNYVLDGKMLESKCRTIFWTPCAAHFIDLMLEDIRKVEWWARRQDGKDTKNRVFDNYFWKRFVNLVKITEPLVKVLRIVDGEKLAMGCYIYEAMDQAKEKIHASYKDMLAKYGHIWEIIDNIWNNQLHHPIHAVGYFLDPKYHYKARLGDLQDGEVRPGLIDCLEHMVPSHAYQLEIHRQLTVFSMETGTFGKNLAKMARDVDQPDCERNWYVFERIHMKKRNHLEQKWLNDLVFMQYNLQLRRNQMMNKTPDLDPIVLDDIDPTSEFVEETKDPVFDADFDIDMALAGDEADLVATSESGSVVA
eukprot:PITA_33798